MSEEKPNVPKLRFPGFADPWEQRKLGEIAHRIIRKNGGNQSNLPLTISAQYGLVDQRDYFNNQVASRDMSGYYLLQNGEFAYNKSTSGDSPWGAVKRLTKYENGCVSTLYICFGLDEGDSDFLVTYYETDRWHKEVRMIAAEGARNHGLLNIAPSDFFETELTMPAEIEEQAQIGAFFQQLDSLITLHQRKLDHLKEMKKGLLQKMFPKNGESIPELRFPGFTDPWEQRKALHLASYSKGKGYSKDDLTESGTPVILYGRLYTKYESVIEEVDTFVDASNDGIYSHGDEVIVPASGETAEDIARASAVAQPGVLLGGDLNILRPNKSITSLFMALSLSNGTAQKELSKRAQGKSVVHVHNSDIQDVTISYPTIDEQTQIGSFFRQLDSLITLHQRKLDHLKQMKKGLLQQMFV